MDQKKDSLNSALGVQNYHLECNETKSWIKEKTKVIESTQELGNDLAGVMALQRKLTGMERDLVAIEDKLGDLGKEAERLASEHAEQSEAIKGRLAEITGVWDDMKVGGQQTMITEMLCLPLISVTTCSIYRTA